MQKVFILLSAVLLSIGSCLGSPDFEIRRDEVTRSVEFDLWYNGPVSNEAFEQEHLVEESNVEQSLLVEELETALIKINQI